MKTWSKFSVVLGVMGGVLVTPWAGPAPPSGSAAAVQAIQQGSDPSAVVTAYANGVASDRNDPKLYEAYIARMVDLGLPEMAYHQAQSLTSLESNHGLAWGVVAYVNARRGEMPEALSAINLAGQFAPDNTFVQRTAGEIVAWYDLKADKSKVPDNAREGLAKVRGLLEKRPVFVEAYDTARKAYGSQTNVAPEPAQAAPSQYAAAPQTPPQGEQVAPSGYAEAAPPPPPPPAYYPDYYYDWGPRWLQPAPWWWWHPVGFFVGFDFCPFRSVLVFDHCGFFLHNRFFCHGRFDFFFSDRFFLHDGFEVVFRDPNRFSFFLRDGTVSFFGAVARPNTSLAVSLRASFHSAPTLASTTAAVRGSTMGGAIASPTLSPARLGMAQPRPTTVASSRATMSQGMRTSRGGFVVPQSMPARPSIGSGANSGLRRPAVGSASGRSGRTWWQGVPRGSWIGQSFRSPGFSVPRMAAPMTPRSDGSVGRAFHGGSAFHGGDGFGGGGRGARGSRW